MCRLTFLATPVIVAVALAPFALPDSAHAADGYIPVERADHDETPRPDLMSRLQDSLMGSLRPRFKDRSSLRVLVVPLAFSDVQGETETERFHEDFFGKRAPSLAAYFGEQSGGKLRIEGHVLPWTEARLPRRIVENAPGALLRGLYYPLLLRRLSADARGRIADADVLVFIMAGTRPSQWGTLLWPHAGTISYRGRSLPKIVLSERPTEGAGLRHHTLWHEFGHVLGIPDKYCYLKSLGLPHRCSIDQVGSHCLMGWGRWPCVWCRLELGWNTAHTLRRGKRQRLSLAPLENGGSAAKIYLGGPSRYLLIAWNHGELRVWRLGEPWRRLRNHLFWADMDCLVAERIEAGDEESSSGPSSYGLPQGIRLDEVHVGEDGALRLRVSFAR